MVVRQGSEGEVVLHEESHMHLVVYIGVHLVEQFLHVKPHRLQCLRPVPSTLKIVVSIGRMKVNDSHLTIEANIVDSPGPVKDL